MPTIKQSSIASLAAPLRDDLELRVFIRGLLSVSSEPSALELRADSTIGEDWALAANARPRAIRSTMSLQLCGFTTSGLSAAMLQQLRRLALNATLQNIGYSLRSVA